MNGHYQIGQLVKVKYVKVDCFHELHFVWMLGVVTQAKGSSEHPLCYKVHTLDGKHGWQPRDDMEPATG